MIASACRTFQVSALTNPSEPLAPPIAVALETRSALSHPGFRVFAICVALVMTADNVEHVISYWVVYNKFHSTWLAGFAVVSHWLPFLLFSMLSGALGDRFDPRRIIQIGLAIFMCVSLSWGVLFYTGQLEMWHAGLLLVVHGLAGVLWNPAAQVFLHDIVEPERLPSAVRLIATARNLGLVAGPAVGALLLSLGADVGIFVNALIYLPAILWLWKAPYGPKFRKGSAAPARALKGFADIMDTLRTVRANPVLISMILLAGGTSFFMGNAYQAQMPQLAHDLGHGKADATYSMLLAADAVGAILAAIVLETTRGLLPPTPRTAFILAMVWCCALSGFALATVYPLAVALLLVAGFVELSFNSMAQALVQLNAPASIRGRVIGVFSMSAAGMRTFSGITIGMVGAVIGVQRSLALSAAVLFVLIGVLLFAETRAERAQ